MLTIKTFIRMHSVLTYYALTFVISWGGILIVAGPRGIPGSSDQFERMVPFLAMAMLAGPVITGILSTGFVRGKTGLGEFLSRLIKWHAGIQWYAIALLSTPILMMAIPLAISIRFPEFIPGIITTSNKPTLLLMGIAMGLMAGIFEELGWTGFAIPQLRLRYSVLTTGLIVGFLWGAWHILINFWSSGDSAGALSLTQFMHSFIFSVGILPPFRVLMVWVYDHTGSLLVAILMHASLTFSNVIFVPQGKGTFLVIWSLVLAAALWAVVAAIAVANRGQLSEQPLKR